MQPEKEIRKSRMELGEVYFWTSSIKEHKHLLKQDKYKRLIIDYWRVLVKRNLITVYGFGIMPNHLHIIWDMKTKNGKELPSASFNKYTSHEIVKDLKLNHPAVLQHFKVDENEREFRIWQRDPLAILMDDKIKLEQKLDYIHNSPLQEHWKLAGEPHEYFWSSDRFYETGKVEFGFLTHYGERF